MLPVSVGDFLLVKEVGNRKIYFVQVKTIDDEKGVIGVNFPVVDHWDRDSGTALVLFDKEGKEQTKVVANFGQNFERGVAYGVKMYNAIGRKPIPFGTLFFCCNPGKKEVLDDILASFDEANEILTKYGLDDLASGDVVYEVHNTISMSGNWKAKVRKGSSKKPAFVYFHTDLIDVVKLACGVSLFTYLILYAIGSLIYKRFFIQPSKLKSEWISEFSLMTKRTTILDDTTEELYATLAAHKYPSIKDMLSDLVGAGSEAQAEISSEEELPETYSPQKSTVLKNILDYIKRHYGLKPDDLDVLYAYDRFDLLRRMWPFGKLRYTARPDSVMKDLLLAKDPEDFFCMAFADYLAGFDDMPPRIVKLCQMTVMRAKTETPEDV